MHSLTELSSDIGVLLIGAEGTPESVKPSAVDDEEEEEGLPSPPLDEGAFFATQPTSMELSEVCFLVSFFLEEVSKFSLFWLETDKILLIFLFLNCAYLSSLTAWMMMEVS